MVCFSYINKFNTIIKDSKLNTSLSPVSELVYGRNLVYTRALFYFDHSMLKNLYENDIMPNMEKMTHILHITNAGSTDFTQLHKCESSSIQDAYKMRAVSFDLIFFLIPKHWDSGKGFNYEKTYFNYGYYTTTPIDPHRMVSEDGCNWFQRENGMKWDEEGVWSNDTLSLEYDKWAAGEPSLVIGRQHFEYGNENIELDITDTVNKFINGDLENYGIGFAFSPLMEVTDDKWENYVGFLTDHTNTFFAPYVETRYCDVISDDRSNFVLNKRNKLYLYSIIGEHLEDLDELPIVTIRNSEEEVLNDIDGNPLENIEAKKFSKGVYYIDVCLSKKDFEEDVMFYDTWTNIKYQGIELDDIELDFVVKPTPNFFNIGTSLEAENITYNPTISGIKEKEQIRRGDVRKLVINARPTYSFNTYRLLDSIDIRLYVRDGTREIDVISWDGVNKAFNDNFYLIDTNMLMPQRYFVDIRISYGMNSIIHHDVLSFDIVELMNNKYD